MKKKDNLQKYKNLSIEYPYFVYESYSISINNDSLNIDFLFNLCIFAAKSFGIPGFFYFYMIVQKI